MNIKLSVGVTPWTAPEGWRAQELCRQAEAAEAMGFDSFWLPENHFVGARAIPSPLLLLAAVAGRTQNIKLGTTSYLLPIRQPLIVAEEVAVLDQLSEGRVILGLGRGMQDEMFSAFDIDPKEKRTIFARNLAAMISAWSGDDLRTGEGGEPVVLAPLPKQRPHPPLWVAAFGPLAIRQVGELGLPYLASPMETLDKLDANYQKHRETIVAAGGDTVSVVPIMRTVFVSESEQRIAEVRQALHEQSAQSKLSNLGDVSEWALIGKPEEVRAQLLGYQQRLGMTHLIARGRIPGVSHQEQVDSHGRLLALVARS